MKFALLLGFLLGMSVLSLFEFVQFIMPSKTRRKLRKLEQPNEGDKKAKMNNNINYFPNPSHNKPQQKY